MTNIDERLHIDCPYVRARAYLHEALQAASENRLPQLLRLTATVPATHIGIAKTVRVEYEPAKDPMHFDEPWNVRWVPEPGGIYPSFAGQLTVRADDTYSTAVLQLTGQYAPPLGAAGRAFDATLGRSIAAQTAQNLLHAIASEMSVRYQAEEAAKAK